MSTQLATPAYAVRDDHIDEPSTPVSAEAIRPLIAWALVAFIVVARIAAYVLLKPNSAHTLVPRSFVGGGFQSMPAVLDLVVPMAVIVALWSTGRFANPQAPRPSAWWRAAAGDAATFLLFPLIAGLTMFAYEERWQVVPNVGLATSLRWLEFVVAFVASNLLLDALRPRWQPVVAALVLAGCFGFFQDVYPGSSNALFVLFSVGATFAWTLLALRRRFRESPVAATAAAAGIGAVSCLLVVMAPSNSAYVFGLSVLALPVGAFAVRARRPAVKWGSLGALAAVGLVMSLVAPRFVPREQRADFLTQDVAPAHAERVDGITVRYDDVRVREIARRMAHVLAAANQVSLDEYGVSPQANELTIRGFAMGGFHAVFPHGIEGNLVSPKHLELSLDSAFLNGDPKTSITFPDPVNALLHEYAHLYGAAPFTPWIMGAENEGWATFAATRLSRQLYARYGAALWTPAYDYAARADAITASNLAGHAVVWSHPNEYGGFRLWSALADAQGEAALFRERWDATRRDLPGWWLQHSDPAAARQVAARFGFARLGVGDTVPVTYRQLYSLREIEAASASWGRPAAETRQAYERRANVLIDPSVPVPSSTPALIDLVLSVAVIAGIVGLAATRRLAA